MADEQSNSDPGPLQGWKEISRYLRVSPRTAQQWEQEQGLPVRRTAGRRGRVYALKSELDAWARKEHARLGQARQDQSMRRLRWKRTLLGGGILAAAAGLLLMRAGSASEAVAVRVETEEITGLDGSGRACWRLPLPGADPRYRVEPELAKTLRLDLEDDGRDEFLVLTVSRPAAGFVSAAEAEIHTLILLESSGRVRWSKKPSCQIPDSTGKPFSDQWRVLALARAKVGRRDRVWLGLGHATRFPGVAAELRPDGSLSPVFVNHGHVNALEVLEYNGKKKLVAGGATNAFRGGFLALLDPDHGVAKAPEGGPARYRLSMPAGAPEMYWLIPSTDLTESSATDVNAVTWIQADGGEAIAGVAVGATTCQLFLEIDAPLRPRAARMNAACGIYHRRYEQQGLLRHRFEQCPDLKDPLRLRCWNPGRGWKEEPVPLATMANQL